MTNAPSPGLREPRRILPLLVFVLLAAGFLVLTGLSLLPLVPGAQRNLTLTNQDLPPYGRYAAFSTPFWLYSGESIKAELVETAYNATSGAFVWRGPVYLVFLHNPLNQTGPEIVSPSTAPQDGYYVLEVHHNDCQAEVALCSVPFEGVVFQTEGTVTIFSLRPYPFLVPSVAVIAAVGSLAGFSLSFWFVVQWRSHSGSRLRDLAKLAVLRPLVLGLIVLAVIIASVGAVDLYYRSQLTTEMRGMGSSGYASENPCIPGQANFMVVYVWVYNGVDEYVDIQLGVVIAGTTYHGGGSIAPPHSWMGAAVLYTSYDCRDPIAQVRVLSATPHWF